MVPGLFWVWPFATLLLLIAILPLIKRTAHWWEHNRNKLLVALVLGLVTLGYYFIRGHGIEVREPDGHSHRTEAGWGTVQHVLEHAVLDEYIPFIVLLFSLYVISGGIQLRGDLVARPSTNVAFLGAGAVLANVIGTTGASMLLIRPLLQTNRERRHVRHTVIFFIFLVSNCGGLLLPIGDPPLFLGYLRGVQFFWTLRLLPQWAICAASLLLIYWVFDHWQYRKEETPLDLALDRALVEPLRLRGSINILWLAGVVAAVIFLVPGQPFLGAQQHDEQGRELYDLVHEGARLTVVAQAGNPEDQASSYSVRGSDGERRLNEAEISELQPRALYFTVPAMLREIVQLVLAGLSMLTTPRGLRKQVGFDFHAIAEVACLFIGIFITMQVPIEILHVRGPQLGMNQPWQFFWITGLLSSFLDNAPTYVVFFETANSLTHSPGPGVLRLLDGSFLREDLLVAISLGAVFMGANTYIGNGPNFMVKSIAERSGVRMPSFFGYLFFWSGPILLPLFLAFSIFGILSWNPLSSV